MSTSVGPVPSASMRTTTSPWSRVYGLGSVYAKTLRDSRLAIIIVGGLLGALLLSSGVALRRGVRDARVARRPGQRSSPTCRRP